MPNKKTSAETQPAPIRTPKKGSKRASKHLPEAGTNIAPKIRPKSRPQRTPMPAPIARPDTIPETIALSFYSLPHWESDHSVNPHRYGNDGKAVGEFHTEADAKDWLRRNGHYGHFAVVERKNGKIGKSWHIEIEAPEEDISTDADSIDEADLGDVDLSMLDPDDFNDSDLLDPKVVRRDIKIAKLEAQLDAHRNAPNQSRLGGPIMDRLLEQLLAERLKPVDPVEETFAKIRALKETEALFTPKASNTAPAPQPQRSEDEILLSAIARNPDVIERFTGGIFKKLLGDGGVSEPDPLIDLAKDAINTGQAAKIVEAAFTGLANLFSPLLSGRLQQQPPQQTQPQPAQPTQPEPTDVQDAPQSVSSPDAAYQETITQMLTMLANNSPVDEAVKLIGGFLFLYPQYADAVDMQLGQAPEMLLSAISAIPGCEQLATLTHAKTWIESFQREFFSDEDATGEATSETNVTA